MKVHVVEAWRASGLTTVESVHVSENDAEDKTSQFTTLEDVVHGAYYTMDLQGGVYSMSTEQLYEVLEDDIGYVDLDYGTDEVCIDGVYTLHELEVICELARRKAAADA